jgi:hypothetical protein
MTRKRLPEKERRARITALQGYITSLLYLREEATRDGLHPVADILQRALASIEAWIDSRESQVDSAALLDSSLCHSLDFLLKWLALPPDKQRQVARTLSQHESENA